MHHCVAGAINNTANRSVEASADTTVKIWCITAPGKNREAARLLHVGQALCQHLGSIHYDHVGDVWHRVAVAVRS